LEKLKLFDQLQAIKSDQIKSISNDFYTRHIIVMDYGDFTRMSQRHDLHPCAGISLFGLLREADSHPVNNSEKISVSQFPPHLIAGVKELKESKIQVIADDDED
jgi:hypothetical protein